MLPSGAAVEGAKALTLGALGPISRGAPLARGRYLVFSVIVFAQRFQSKKRRSPTGQTFLMSLADGL
jgi:hypothetical protein